MNNKRNLILARYLMIVLGVVLGLALFASSAAAAKSTRVYFTSTETCPDPLPQNMGKQWVADGFLQIRGLTNDCTDVGNTPQITGTNHVTLNATISLADGTGHMWGKTTFDSIEGGRWAITWTAKVTADTTTITAVGQGQGIYEGQKLFWTLVNVEGAGYILKPHGE